MQRRCPTDGRDEQSKGRDRGACQLMGGLTPWHSRKAPEPGRPPCPPRGPRRAHSDAVNAVCQSGGGQRRGSTCPVRGRPLRTLRCLLRGRRAHRQAGPSSAPQTPPGIPSVSRSQPAHRDLLSRVSSTGPARNRQKARLGLNQAGPHPRRRGGLAQRPKGAPLLRRRGEGGGAVAPADPPRGFAPQRLAQSKAHQPAQACFARPQTHGSAPFVIFSRNRLRRKWIRRRRRRNKGGREGGGAGRGRGTEGRAVARQAAGLREGLKAAAAEDGAPKAK
jgi:hypothetical protein